MGRTPCVDRSRPSSDSSPRNRQRRGVRDDLLRGDDDAYGNRQVEAGPFLADVRRGEADGDAAIGENATGVAYSGAHPFARLLHRRVRQTDDVDPRQPGEEVDLDLDELAFEADDGG